MPRFISPDIGRRSKKRAKAARNKRFLDSNQRRNVISAGRRRKAKQRYPMPVSDAEPVERGSIASLEASLVSRFVGLLDEEQAAQLFHAEQSDGARGGARTRDLLHGKETL